MRKLWVPLSICAALSGCATGTNWLYKGYGAAPVGADVVEPYGELVKILKTGDGTTPLVTSECFGLAGTDTGNSCQRQRNNAIAALMLGSENSCLLHRKTMYGNEASYNIAFGSAASLFAGMASVVSDAHRKSILAALSLFSNAERSLINETVYKTMLVPIVDKKIVELRDAKAQAMQARLKEPLDKYSVNEALSDWTSFHSACSFMTGLQKALDEGAQGGNAQKMLRLNASLGSVNTQLAACSDAAKAANPALDSQCKALLARQARLNEELTTLESQ